MRSRLLLLSALIVASGCASSIKTSQVRVTAAPPAGARAITNEVTTQVAGAQEAQSALSADLRDAFATLGYRIGSGDLVLKATITQLHLGDTAANVTIGLGIGRDTIDVSVALSDTKGTVLMTFLVHGAAIDKRYSDLGDVIRGIARKIAAEVKAASK